MSAINARDGALRNGIRTIRVAVKTSVRRFLAGRGRRRSSATFIAVTGSSAKTTTSALLADILERHARVRKQVFDNTEGDIAAAMRRLRPTDEYVVLEMGVGMKGDMDRFMRLVKPDVAIVTLIGLEHYSEFRSREAVAQEKGGLVEAVRPGGFALLNADDPHVMSMAERTKERIVTFGRDNEADYRAVSVSFRFPGPLVVEIAAPDGAHRVATNLVGAHFWLSVTAAFAVARELGVPVETILEACAEFEPPDGRCEVLRVPGGPTFVLDTGKAPWETIGLSMQAIADADAPRKRIVVGQISDYPGSSRPKYRGAYKAAREVGQEVIFAGDNAHRHGASEEDRAAGRIVELRTAREVHDYLRRTAIEDEVVLIKSAQLLHLERAALGFTHDVKCWEHVCGERVGCIGCGLYEYPFEQHKALRRRRKRDRQLQRLRSLFGLKG